MPAAVCLVATCARPRPAPCRDRPNARNCSLRIQRRFLTLSPGDPQRAGSSLSFFLPNRLPHSFLKRSSTYNKTPSITSPFVLHKTKELEQRNQGRGRRQRRSRQVWSAPRPASPGHHARRPHTCLHLSPSYDYPPPRRPRNDPLHLPHINTSRGLPACLHNTF